MLTVTGKNDQTRLVLLHLTTVMMLTRYAAQRDRICPAAASPAFFHHHHRPPRPATRRPGNLRQAAGPGRRPGATRPRRPRIHDLRHTFVVTTLIGWYRSGADVQARLPVLSTFLGHSCPEATYWYLQATPELLALAVERLEPLADHSSGNCGRPS